MKTAISNIAWEPEHDAAVAAVMVELGVGGVEIAPTKIWPSPLDATAVELRDYRRWWEDRGLTIVSLQALLYGRPDLTIFEDDETRRTTLDYLRGIMALAAELGAGPLVFGSPRNRLRGGLDPAAATDIAVTFFRQAGAIAAEHGVLLCIEPNPTAYACDFVNTSAEGRELVRRVDHPGFGLHLDAAGMTLSGEPLGAAIEACRDDLRHFHVSEPELGAIGRGGVDHAGAASALRRIGYPRWVSVEMRRDPAGDTVAEVRRVLEFVQEVYGVA